MKRFDLEAFNRRLAEMVARQEEDKLKQLCDQARRSLSAAEAWMQQTRGHKEASEDVSAICIDCRIEHRLAERALGLVREMKHREIPSRPGSNGVA